MATTRGQHRSSITLLTARIGWEWRLPIVHWGQLRKRALTELQLTAPLRRITLRLCAINVSTSDALRVSPIRGLADHRLAPWKGLWP
jgi:hypothetical protein